MSVLNRVKAYVRMYPVVRGMATYATVWPTSCVCQQLIVGTPVEELDYMRVLRFGIYGCFYVAPTLWCWIRLTTAMWPQKTVKVAVKKALVEQLTYGPFAIISFFYGMTLLEGKGLKAAAHEVNEKFFQTYKVGLCVWPIAQTINHSMIPEKNKVPFISVCSLGWTCFLAYMYHKEKEQKALLLKQA